MRTTTALLLGALAAAAVPLGARATETMEIMSAPTQLKLGVRVHYGFATTDRAMALTHQSCWTHLAHMTGYVEGPIPTPRPIEYPPGYTGPKQVLHPVNYRYGIAFDLLPSQVGHCSLILHDSSGERHIEITITS